MYVLTWKRLKITGLQGNDGALESQTPGGLLHQLLEQYWEFLHSEASGIKPALKDECHELSHGAEPI